LVSLKYCERGMNLRLKTEDLDQCPISIIDFNMKKHNNCETSFWNDVLKIEDPDDPNYTIFNIRGYHYLIVDLKIVDEI
jgi:hypothetical protein